MTLNEAKAVCKFFNKNRPPYSQTVAEVFVDTTDTADSYIPYICDAETGAIVNTLSPTSRLYLATDSE